LLVEHGCRRTRSTVYWIRARKPKLGCERNAPALGDAHVCPQEIAPPEEVGDLLGLTRMLERAREEVAVE